MLEYRKDTVLPIHLELNDLSISMRIGDDEGTYSLQKRCHHILYFEEKCIQATKKT